MLQNFRHTEVDENFYTKKYENTANENNAIMSFSINIVKFAMRCSIFDLFNIFILSQKQDNYGH